MTFSHPKHRSARSRRAAATGGLAAVLLLVAGCAAAGGGGGVETPALPAVVLERGTVYPFREQEADRLLREAAAALEAERYEEAREGAARIVDEYPSTVASGPSLLVLARAELGLGRHDEARRRVDRYEALLPPGDPRAEEVRLFRAEELLAYGRPVEAVRAILALPVELAPDTRHWALHRLRSAVEALDRSALAGILGATPLGQPLAAPVMIRYARLLQAAGAEEEARRYARAALQNGAVGPERQAASELLGRSADETGVEGGAAAGAERAAEEERARQEAEAEEEARRQREAEQAAEEARLQALRQREAEEEARRQREAEEEARRQREADEEARRQREADEEARRQREAEEEARRQERAVDRGPGPVVVEPSETMYPFRERQAADLLEQAVTAFDAGRFEEAARQAGAVVESYPSTLVSGEALWLQARSARRAGREDEARRLAERYAGLLDPADPRLEDVSIFMGADAAEVAAARREAEEEARRQREAEEEARRQREAEEEARRQREAEEEARRQREAEEEARRQREAEEEARRQREAEEEARRQREAEEEARRQREAEEEARRQREAEEEARRQREAEEEARRQREAEEEARRQRQAEEAVRTRRGGAEAADDLAPLVVEPQGTMFPFREREAHNLLEEARAAYARGERDRALSRTADVLENFPSTTASGPALWLRARTLLAAGREEEAWAAAERYATLLPPGDPRWADIRLFRAEGALRAGEVVPALDSVLNLPTTLPSGTHARALGLVRGIVANLDRQTLGAVLQATPLGQPLAAPLMLAYARALRADGDDQRASRFAEAALAVGAEGSDEVEARALLRLTLGARDDDPTQPPPGRPGVDEPVAIEETPPPAGPTPADPAGPFELAAPVTVGALLPRSGSPVMRRYADLVEEGIRVALEGADAPAGITVRVEDDGGRPADAARALQAIVGEQVIGVVGPLEDAAVQAAADARTAPVPIISPTALSVGGREAVYTLGGPDPGAARALARYAVESGMDQVVIIHPDEEEYAYEAAVFRARMLELGGSVLRVIAYSPGTTTFGEVLRSARFLEPEALMLPAPARDIQALAPQVSFYGLDTLGIRVMGTGEWTSDEVIRSVAARHTNGVIVATAQPPEGESEGYRRFVESYERHFQRSLRDPVPALGYDAASLLLEGLRSGARTPEELRAALEEVEDFQGATGVLSIEEGRVVRRHHVACIQDGALRSVPPGEQPTPYRPERRGDMAAGEPERVPLGPLQVFCPGVPVPDSAHIMSGPPRGAPVPVSRPEVAPTRPPDSEGVAPSRHRPSEAPRDPRPDDDPPGRGAASPS